MPPVTRTTEPPRRGGRGARQRILKAAAELFYCEGINATGVELIANKASVSKRTLYQHFPSKSALVEEYLRGLRQAAGEADKMPKASNATPRERLLALFDRPNRGDGRMRGCPFHNAAVEAAGEMPESSGSSTRTNATTSKASPGWPEKPAQRIRAAWAINSPCCSRARPHCPPPSTMPAPGRTPERQRRS